jgi:AP-1 complex subunit gamma-1
MADERATIQRESALIRTSFKDTTLTHNTRRINIQKLVYLYIIGEKTHFGQIECIKLLASSNFVDKRLGYLASMLILDENQEILTLLTNSLNNDLNHPNQFIVALALSTLGNIASYELSNDLYADVEKIIAGNNAYLQKKALMVASKLVEKNVELAEMFLPKVFYFLSSSDHGILLSDLKLIRSIFSLNAELRPEIITKSIEKIIEIMKNLIDKSNLNHEYDVMSINDPFLQLSIIKTLNLFFIDKDQASVTSKYIDSFQDLLTNVLSYTTIAKNSGASILYESIKTIFDLDSSFDPSLKILAINTLSHFLTNNNSTTVKDINNNNRYVALNTLLDVVNYEPLAVKRHRSIIIQCLNDLDMSIKRRALELSFAILDSSNIRILVKEILVFLENPINNDKDLKIFIIKNLTNILSINELIPNEKWKFDTIIKFLNIIGSELEFSELIISKILALILNINDNELKSYTINKIFQISYSDDSKIGLNLINVYLVGEYGDFLVNSKLTAESSETITESTLTNYLINLNDQNSQVLISYLLTSSLKLFTKLPSGSANRDLLKEFVRSKENSIDLSIQLKSVNFTNLINELNKNPHALSGVLDRIPPPPIVANNDRFTLTTRSKTILTSTSAKASTTTEDLLLDLMDDDNIGGPDSTGGKTNVDLLEDIFGNSSKQYTQPSTSQKDELLNLFDSPSVQSQATQSQTKGVKIYQNEDIEVYFELKSLVSGSAQIESIIKNRNFSKISKFQILFAVPKTQKLTILNSSNSSDIAPNSDFKQELKIVGKEGTKLKLRIKASYEINGESKLQQFDHAFEKSL